MLATPLELLILHRSERWTEPPMSVSGRSRTDSQKHPKRDGSSARRVEPTVECYVGSHAKLSQTA
jgi:hypothetical protein